jgi:transposase
MTKEWIVIHKIRSLFDNGQGLSIRAISNELGISRNTVRKYLRMDDLEIFSVKRYERASLSHDRLNFLQPYLIHMLAQFPNIKSAKLAKKIMSKLPDLNVSERTLRRHIRAMREDAQADFSANGEPVIDMVPGVQCQVHMGVIPDVVVSGKYCKVHVLGFALSYSKLMALDFKLEPYTIHEFINGHDAAFRYFGGVPEECVYDRLGQTHVKPLIENFDSSQQLYQYASGVGVRIRLVDGYKADDRDKVEPLIEYVSSGAFGGECFPDEVALDAHVRAWLDTSANQRMHHVTGREPCSFFEEREKVFLRPWQRPG